MAWDNPKKRKVHREYKRARRAAYLAAKRAEEDEEDARKAVEEAAIKAVEEAAGGAANLSGMMNEIQLVPQAGGRGASSRNVPCGWVDSPGDAIAGLHPRLNGEIPRGEIPSDDDVPCLGCGGVDRPEDFVLCEGCDQGGHTNCVALTSVPEGDWFCDRCEASRGSGPGHAATLATEIEPGHAATLATENARLRRYVARLRRDLTRAMSQLDVGGAGEADRVEPRERPDYEGGEDDEIAIDSACTSDSVFDLSGGCEVEGCKMPVVFVGDDFAGRKYGPVGRGKYFARLPPHDHLPRIADLFKSGMSLMPRRRKFRVLDLCCGTKALKKALTLLFNSKGFEVEYIGLDWNAEMEPEVCGNVTQWRKLLEGKLGARRVAPGYFDFIWSSPECKKFSNGRHATTKTEINEAMEYVRACKECILFFSPPSWVMENPDGKLKHQDGMFPGRSTCPLMRYACRFTVSYCKYGELYQKDTLLWTNMVGLSLERCTACTRCAPVRGGLLTHAQVAQYGPSVSTGAAGVGKAGVNKLYAPPTQLLVTICAYAAEQARSWRFKNAGC